MTWIIVHLLTEYSIGLICFGWLLRVKSFQVNLQMKRRMRAVPCPVLTRPLCRHVFHKVCVDPWLNEHCTCPICKLNILKALGITVSGRRRPGLDALGSVSLMSPVPRPVSPAWTAWCWTWSVWASVRRLGATGCYWETETSH